MRRALLIQMLLSLAVTAQAQAVDMLVYPNTGVFELADGNISGPGAAMLERLQSLSGVRLDQKAVPIARALQMVLQKPGACIVATPRTPDRKADFQWVGPWANSAYALYGRADETRQVTGPEDMRGIQIAVMRETLPVTWLENHGLLRYEVNDISTGLRMVQAGRVRFWLGSELAARFAIKTLKGPLPRVLYSFDHVDLYIGCHAATPAEHVKRLNAAIEKMRRGGELAEFGLR